MTVIGDEKCFQSIEKERRENLGTIKYFVEPLPFSFLTGFVHEIEINASMNEYFRIHPSIFVVSLTQQSEDNNRYGNFGIPKRKDMKIEKIEYPSIST
jgi:hypothetical protein